MAVAVESLERRYLLSGTSALNGPASWAAYTPLIVVNASTTLSAPFTAPEIRQAYGLNQITGNGAGETIAIIDAYNDPNIVTDANTFSGTYGLETFNTSGGPTLTVENEFGSTSNLPPNSQLNAPDGQQWDVEESLDVEWAHTIAPMANIILLEANTPSFDDLFTAVQTAASTAGVSTVSMSFSGGEFNGEQSFDNTFTTPNGHGGVTFVGATGDSSFPGGYPAVSQNVLAVGGTSLTINSDGSYGGESAWSGGGGNISDYETQPVYQNLDASKYTLTQRTTPDVSWLADPNTGVEVLDSYDGGWQQIGGTSVATPMWAALISIVDQGCAANGLSSLDTAQTHALLYSLPESDFHDIISGSNGYPAITGYDVATGLGTPNVPLLVSAMTGENAIFVDGAAPGTVQNGSSWADAYTSLQAALSASTPGTTILTAQGTFTPTSGTDRTATFQLEDGVTLLGGFAGYGATNPDASGSGFTTTLSGDIGAAGNTSDNSYHVATASDTDSSAILDGFTITAGNADGSGDPNSGNGAGLFDSGGSPTVTDCTFTSNLASSMGGAVYASSSSAAFDDCTFSNDFATNGGGGVFSLSSSLTLTNSIFTDDFAGAGLSGFGGGMFDTLSSPLLENCLFNGNMSDNGGGGIYDSDSSPTLTNCTLTANSALGIFGRGGAIDNVNSSSPTLANCIVWANTAAKFAGIFSDATSASNMTYCDLQVVAAGIGNISADPMFANSAQGDFQLQETSPCIDAGSNAAVPANLTTDLAGFSRIVGTTVDMGAYESQTLYVDARATGAKSGGTWADAFASLAAAMNLAQWGQTIDVAGGIYTPTATDDRTATFLLLDNVALYGGFAGSATSNPFTRNVATYPSILSGDIGAAGDNSDNSYHVVSILTNVSPTSILDGFTITAGNANAGGDGNSSLGGGIFEIGGSPTINDCIITANQANGAATTANGDNSDGFGAGMFDFQGSPTITNCQFTSNSTTGEFAFGAGLMDEFAAPTIINCTFSDNSDGGQANRGGALFSYMSNETLIACTFTANLVNDVGYGGAIFNDSSSPSLVNCVFSGNAAVGSNPFAAGWGGAVFNFTNSAPVFTNCTFTDNSADLGGAIADFTTSTPTLVNCIAYGDSDFFGYEVYDNGDGSAATITYSDIAGGATGTGNINADPQFVDAAAGNFALEPTSPCINAGNNAAIQSTGVTTDILGNPRIQGGTVDMGAYEASFGPITWTGAGDGINWSDPANWSDNLVPTQNNTVTIPSGVADVQIGGGAFSVGALTSSSPIEILGAGSLTLFGAAVENSTLTIDTGGTLDIQNNSLTINFASSAVDPLTTIQGYLQSGYNADTWTGSGIISSLAQADPGLYAVGYADGNLDVGTPAQANQIYVKNTLAGDANLDGTVNFADLLAVSQNFNKSLDANGKTLDWADGNFNYDSAVNFADLLLVAQNFNKNLAADEAAQTPTTSAPAQASAATTQIGDLSLSTLSAPALDGPMNPFPISVIETAPIPSTPPLQPAAAPVVPSPPTPAAVAISPSPCTQGEGRGEGSSTLPTITPFAKISAHAVHFPSPISTASTQTTGIQPIQTKPAINVPASPTPLPATKFVNDIVTDLWSALSPNNGPLFSNTLLTGGSPSALIA